jgi:hypothetical protein
MKVKGYTTCIKNIPWIQRCGGKWLMATLQNQSSRTAYVSIKNTIFWDTTPCSSLKVIWRLRGTLPTSSGSKLCLPPAFVLVSCSAYSLTLKMEAMFLQNIGWLSTDYTALYPKDRTLHNHWCENLKSYMVVWVYWNYIESSHAVHNFASGKIILFGLSTPYYTTSSTLPRFMSYGSDYY